MSIVFYIVLAYLLYRFIFNFLIPIIRTTRQVRRGFRNMQDQMNQHMNGGAPYTRENVKPSASPKKGDYIDFEEIKD